MTLAFLTILSGLALADSLNPATVAAQAYLLGTPRPMARALAFLVGTFLTYFAGGFVLLEGWMVFLRNLAPLIPWWGLGVGEVALGLATVGFGLWSLARASAGTPFRPPEELSVPAALAFAVVSTVSDLPTALPYFAAANRIAELDGPALQLAALGWYNLTYCWPMIALLVAHATLRQARSEAIFGRLRAGIDWAFAKLLPPVLLLAGATLAVDGARRLLTA